MSWGEKETKCLSLYKFLNPDTERLAGFWLPSLSPSKLSTLQPEEFLAQNIPFYHFSPGWGWWWEDKLPGEVKVMAVLDSEVQAVYVATGPVWQSSLSNSGWGTKQVYRVLQCSKSGCDYKIVVEMALFTLNNSSLANLEILIASRKAIKSS